MLIADGGGGYRPTVVPTVNQPKPQPASAKNNSSAAADRARELQRQIEALLERIREMQRQAAEARRRAAEAQQKAEAARQAADAARRKADQSKLTVDESEAKKAEQAYALADARVKKETADAQRHDKEAELATAQVAQKKEAKKSADGKASDEANQKVDKAQEKLDAARRTSNLSNDNLDYQEKETKAQDAEAKVAKLTPAPGRPSDTITDAESSALETAQDKATKLRTDADAAKDKFTTAVGAEAPLDFYGAPPATQAGDPATQVPGGAALPNDPLHSPLLQFLQVSPASSIPGSVFLAPRSTLKPAVTAEVTKTLSGIADGKTVGDIAKQRGMTADQVVSEAKAAGVTIESGQADPKTQKSGITVKRDDSTLVYTRDDKTGSLTVKATFADRNASGTTGTKTVEATRDKDGRFIQAVKDNKTGDTTTHIIDPNAGTRTDVVEKSDGTRTETTTDLTGATVKRAVKPGEDYLDVAKAAGLSPEQLLALNPGVDYGKPLKDGQELVVSDVRTTTTTTQKDGTKLEKTVESDGSQHVVATTHDGRRVTLMGEGDPDKSQGEEVRKGLFDDNKSVADLAKSMGMTEEQVLAALPPGAVNDTKSKSDGATDIRTIYDPKSNKVIVETHDHRRDRTSREVIDDKTSFKVRQYDPDSKKYVMKDVAGGVGYLQKLADDQRNSVGDLDQKISDLDKTIRLYSRMGESTTDLRSQRQDLVDQRDNAKGESDIAQARATSGLLENQQVQLDKVAADAYQRLSVARPGSDEQKEATKALDDILALTDKVDRLVKSGDKDVEFLVADLGRQQKHKDKVDADENLQAAFQKWKDEVWMWQTVDDKTAKDLKEKGQRPATRVFASTDQENEVAWEAFEYQQESWAEYGTDDANDIELAARNAWVKRDEAGVAEVKSNDKYYQVAVDKGNADAHVVQGDIDRLQSKKDAWVAAHPKDFSENFPAVKGEHGGQQALDELNDQRTELEVGVVVQTKDQKYNQFLEGLSVEDREDPEKLKEKSQEYGEKHAKDIEAYNQKINDLQMAGLNQRAKVSDAYVIQWAKDNPKLQDQLDALSTKGITNLRMVDNLLDQRKELLNSSHEFKQLSSALNLQSDTEFKLTQVGDQDVAGVQRDLDGIDKTVEGQTWLRDMWSNTADESQEWTQDQRDQVRQLRDDLASGKISATEFTQRRDELMDSYGFESIDVGQKLQDNNETWAVVDDVVRMAATAAAGIGTTLLTGNIVAGIAVGIMVNQAWDSTNDIYAAANGNDIYADGHSSLFTLGVRGAATLGGADDLTLDETLFTLKDDAVDIANAAVSATGAGAGLRTSGALTAKVAMRKGLDLAAGDTLKWSARAGVGAKAGFVAQGVDGAGRVAVETLDVGLDGQLGSDEGAARIGTTITNGLVGLGTSWITGGISAAIPLNRATIFSPTLVAQGANDLAGSYGTGQLISLANNGRTMNGNETIAAALQAVPGTILNIGLHPSWHEKPAGQPASARTPRTPGVDQDGNPLVPESLPGGWDKVAADADALISTHEQSLQPGSTVAPHTPSASETALLRWLQQDPAPGAGTVFVVSTRGPKDTIFASDGGVRARNSDTYGTFAEAKAAAAAAGGAWVNRAEPRTSRLPVSARVRLRADELVGAMHVNKDGNVLPYGIPNSKHGDLRLVPTGDPGPKARIKNALAAEPTNAKIDPIQMMNIAAGARFVAEAARATSVFSWGSNADRVMSVAPGPLSGFGRVAYLSSSQRGKEALAAATVGNTDKANKLINKVIKGTGLRGDKVLDPADAQTMRDNVTKVGEAGTRVQKALEELGVDAPSAKTYRMHELDKPADLVPALKADSLDAPGMDGFVGTLRAETGGEFQGKSVTDTQTALVKRLDGKDADELQQMRDDAANTSPEARLLREVPSTYDRLHGRATARTKLNTAHKDLYNLLVGIVGVDGKINRGNIEGLSGRPDASDILLGKSGRNLGEEALAAATLGDTNKAGRLIDKVIAGATSPDGRVLAPADAQAMRDNIASVGDAGKKVQSALDKLGADAPRAKLFRLKELKTPADLVPVLKPESLAVRDMHKLVGRLRADAGGDFHDKSALETLATLAGRLDAMDAGELQQARDAAANTSPEARLLREFPTVYERLHRRATGRTELKAAHQDLYDTLVRTVGVDTKLNMGAAEGLAGSTNSPNTQLGKFSRRAVIISNVNLAVGAGFKQRAVGDGGGWAEFANVADFFTIGTAGMNIVYNRKVESLSDVKAAVKAEAEDAGMTYDEYMKGTSPEQIAAQKLVKDANGEKDKWNKYRDFAGITSGVRAFAQGVLLMQLDFSAVPGGAWMQGGLVGASFLQGTLTVGWVGLQQYMPLRNGNLPNFTKYAKWTTAAAIVVVPLTTQILTAFITPGGEKKDSYYAALWKMVFPDNSPVNKNGALPWAVPTEHAGDPPGDTGFARVDPEPLPGLQPVQTRLDGGGTTNPALAQLFNLSPRFESRVNDGNVPDIPGDPDRLLDSWDFQLGDRWATA